MRAMVKAFDSKYQYGIFHIMFTGIGVTTLYAQIISLFSGVGLWANVFLIAICLCGFLAGKKNMVQEWRIMNQQLFETISKKRLYLGILVTVLAMVCFALASAGPAKLIDTDWYHAQTIRWIEEYGCVKGVANLFTSLGFNSSQHYFDALFSMKFLFGQSLKGTGGYFGLLLFLHGWFRLLNIRRGDRTIGDIITPANAMAAAEIVYVIIITAFFTDPYTDTLPNCLSFFILTEWIALLEEKGEGKKEEVFPYAFLCILAVFATVVKTSAAILILLVIQPAIMLIQNKEWKKIGGYLLIGLLSAVPFFLTNIKTSGYLVYLASGVDLFDVPWKIDVEVLRYSVDSMIHDARGVNKTMEEVLDVGLRWIPDWFRNESISHQILYLAVLGVFLFDVMLFIKDMIVKRKQDIQHLLVRGVIYLSLFYWLMTIPQVKYSWTFLLAPLVLVPAYYIRRERGLFSLLTKAVGVLAAGVLLLYAGFYTYRTIGYIKTAVPDYLVKQADYEHHSMASVEIGGLTFYIRDEESDILCGYYVFPYINDESVLESLEVGESLKDGFYIGQ